MATMNETSNDSGDGQYGLMLDSLHKSNDGAFSVKAQSNHVPEEPPGVPPGVPRDEPPPPDVIPVDDPDPESPPDEPPPDVREPPQTPPGKPPEWVT